MDKRQFMSPALFAFIRNNVLSITELTRSNKLAEILNKFSEGVTEEVFVVQNTKSKDAKGVFIDLEFFEELLRYRQLVEEAKDRAMYKMALKRKDDSADIGLAAVLEQHDLNVEDIVALVDEVDIE